MVKVKQNVFKKIGDKTSKVKINKKVKAKKLKDNKLTTIQKTVIIKPEKQTPALDEKKKEVSKKEASPKKSVKYVMPTESITGDIVDNCLNALLNVIVKHDKKKAAIFDDEKRIFAEIRCIKIQNTRGNVRL